MPRVQTAQDRERIRRPGLGVQGWADGWADVHDLPALDLTALAAVRIAAPPALAVKLVEHEQLPVLGIGRLDLEQVDGLVTGELRVDRDERIQRRSGTSLSWNGRRLGAIERHSGRHDPDRSHEHCHADDTRREALVPALAIASALERIEPIGRQWDNGDGPLGALEQCLQVRHLGVPPFLECRSCLRGERAHRTRPDPEDRASLLGAVAEKLGNDDGGPLPRGKRRKRADGLVVVNHLLERVVRDPEALR